MVDFRVILGTTRIEPWYHQDNLLDPKLLHIHKPHYGEFLDLTPALAVEAKNDRLFTSQDGIPIGHQKDIA